MEMILKIAGGLNPHVSMEVFEGLRMNQEMEKTFEVGIEDAAFYPVMEHCAIKSSNPSWRFARLGDRWMD